MNKHPALHSVDHRPWPVPEAKWTWRQSWLDLAFAHWPVPAERLRELIPSGLELDEFDGTPWLGLVPFRMQGVMRRPLPDVPGLSAFPELNVRTYVRHGTKPGVWFLSLDATNPFAVWAAQRFFHLPYHRARIQLSAAGEEIVYRSLRRGGGPVFAGKYRPSGPVFMASPATLEHWLTERYCLYAQAPDGTLWRTDVHHVPWPLQPAELTIERNTMFEPYGFSVAGAPTLVHFARRVDVVTWSPARLDE